MTDSLQPNESQLRAITFDINKPLRVVAGAGTGKTAVLTKRFTHLVEKHGIRPERILALTFTKKAAAEMQSRITDELLRKKLVDRSLTPLLVWIGNFHSICLSLLKQHSLTVGLDPSFMVVEETEQRLMIAEIVHDFMNGSLGLHTNPVAYEALMIEQIEDFTDCIVKILNRLKAHFITAERLQESVGAFLIEQYEIVSHVLEETVANDSLHRSTRSAAQKRKEQTPLAKAYEQLLLSAVGEIYDAYQERLEGENLLDFGDLIYRTYLLAQLDPSVKQRFDYILVDEFQDTDIGQFRLLKALSPDLRNVTVVCDKKQSIYEWRGARIENIDAFSGETIYLEENYRSFGEILETANWFIRHSMPMEHPLIPARKGGRGSAGSPRVRLFRAPARESEAQYVGAEILRLLEEEECVPSEIAILMRSVNASRPFEDALRNNGIRYTTVGGRGFYELKETKDLLAFLRVISNPFDDLSMVRIMQSVLLGLNDATLSKLFEARKKSDSGIYDVLKRTGEIMDSLSKKTSERLQRFVDTIEDLARLSWSLGVGEIISAVLDRMEYLKYLASVEGPRGLRFANVARFYKMAAYFEERHPGTSLEGFLAYVEAALAADVTASTAESALDAVQIMTVHQSKGLEFPVVFIVNLSPGAFPLKFRADRFGYDESVGFFVRKMPEDICAVRYEGGYGVSIEESMRRRCALEESRIMYVAMTRAERLLYLTTSVKGETNKVDFFHMIEQLTSSDDRRCATLMDFPSVTVRDGRKQDEAIVALDAETIKSEAVKAVERMTPPSPVKLERHETGILILSYSRLSMFRHCPMKYALRYMYNLPLSPHEESSDDDLHGADAFLLGNLLHTVLMQFHRRKRAGSNPDAFKIFESLSQSVPDEVVRAGRKMLKEYLDSPLSCTDTIHEEKNFCWRIGSENSKIVLEGQVDRIHREKGILKIVDYKTGRRDPVNHALQLGIYRLAMESALGERGILTSDFYLASGEEAESHFSDEELEQIVAGIVEDAQRITQRDFTVDKADRHRDRDCDNCGYEEFCPHRRGD